MAWYFIKADVKHAMVIEAGSEATAIAEFTRVVESTLADKISIEIKEVRKATKAEVAEEFPYINCPEAT